MSKRGQNLDTPSMKSLESHCLMAVDPSLTCSGWALFNLASESLMAVGKLRSLPPSYSLSDRLLALQSKVQETLKECGLGQGDYLVAEAPTTMRDPRSAFRVEQVRGLFETVARSRRIKVPGRVNPRSVQREVMGLKGKQITRERVKETAVLVAQALYESDFRRLEFPGHKSSLAKHQDIVDAILIGRLALIRIKSALQAGIPPQRLFDEKLTPRSGRGFR